MPKLYSSKHIIKVLTARSFVYVSQKGSHAKFKQDNLTVIVPTPKKEIPHGTFKSILRQSNLADEDFNI